MTFWEALKQERPLQVVGTINAYVAMMAERVGFRALYLSGAGVANSSYGLPDIGITTLDNVLEDVRRITSAVNLPLLVDIDTGWGNALLIKRVIKSMIRAVSPTSPDILEHYIDRIPLTLFQSNFSKSSIARLIRVHRISFGTQF